MSKNFANLSDFIEFFGNSESAFARGAHTESLVRRPRAIVAAPHLPLSSRRFPGNASARKPDARPGGEPRAPGQRNARLARNAQMRGKCGARPTSPTCSSIRHDASRRMELKFDISMNNICSMPMIAVAAQTRWRGRSGSSRLFRLSISLSVYLFLILHGGISAWIPAFAGITVLRPLRKGVVGALREAPDSPARAVPQKNAPLGRSGARGCRVSYSAFSTAFVWPATFTSLNTFSMTPVSSMM